MSPYGKLSMLKKNPPFKAVMLQWLRPSFEESNFVKIVRGAFSGCFVVVGRDEVTISLVFKYGVSPGVPSHSLRVTSCL